MARMLGTLVFSWEKIRRWSSCWMAWRAGALVVGSDLALRSLIALINSFEVEMVRVRRRVLACSFVRVGLALLDILGARLNSLNIVGGY